MNEDYMFEDENENEKSSETEKRDIYGDSYYSQHYNQYQEEPGHQPIGKAVASLILGVLSLVFFLTGLNLITAIIAIVLGIIFIATRKQKDGKPIAAIGIITAIVSIVMFFMSWSYLFTNVSGILRIEEDILKMYQDSDGYLSYPEDLDDIEWDETL